MAEENVGLAGALYWHATAVTNAVANEVAEFRGGWTAEIIETTAEWFGQSTVRKDAELTQLDIKFAIPEVAFVAKKSTAARSPLVLLYGASMNESDTLKDVGGTAATSFTFSSSTTPPEGNWLVECQLDGKTFQAFATDAIILGTAINFTNMDYVVHNVEMLLYSATGSLAKFIYEN